MVSEMAAKYAVVQYADLKKYERIIVISDIHGDSESFLGVLNQVAFSQKDALVIVGDMIEKGEHSLEVLRMVTEYAKSGNVYVLLGNNDAILLGWINDEISDPAILGYISSRDCGVIHEMAQEIGIRMDTEEQVKELKELVKEKYASIIEFLQGLPHILEWERATFAHAGIKPGSLQEQEYEFCLSVPAFGNQTHHFEKPVIVGHWPISNYCSGIINVNPYWNQETNVISIDGGNSMKSWCQLNYLILYPDQEMQMGYFDRLPKIRLLDDQKETPEAFTLAFPNTQIEILQENGADSRCYVPYLKKELTIEKDRIYEYKNKMYSYDFTTYDLGVKAGEIVSFCMEVQDGVLVKRNGIVGNYHGRYEFIPEEG